VFNAAASAIKVKLYDSDSVSLNTLRYVTLIAHPYTSGRQRGCFHHSDLSDETFHIQIFQDTADYGMCEQVRGRQRKHQARSDICNCLVEVRRVLQIALAERANVKE
jgi:hypothetical protein